MRHISSLFLLGAVVLAPALHAADAPMRKPGLWEIRTESRAGA